jgi:hypothetical protein
LRPTADLNNALVSMILTGHDGFSTSAGHIGPQMRVDHDISLLVPEIWARLRGEHREASWLIGQGYMEALEDFDFEGRRVLASRLGYRINERFVAHYMGKIFDNPREVFTEAILKPETQDLAVFADGVHNIAEAQERVARRYFEDGSIEEACPPLKALLAIMAMANTRAWMCTRRRFALCSREALLASDWYRQRLQVKRARPGVAPQLDEPSRFQQTRTTPDEARRLDLGSRIAYAQAQLDALDSPTRGAHSLNAGADPLEAIEAMQIDIGRRQRRRTHATVRAGITGQATCMRASRMRRASRETLIYSSSEVEVNGDPEILIWLTSDCSQARNDQNLINQCLPALDLAVIYKKCSVPFVEQGRSGDLGIGSPMSRARAFSSDRIQYCWR